MRNSVGNSDRLGNSRVMVAHRPVSAIEICTDGVCCRGAPHRGGERRAREPRRQLADQIVNGAMAGCSICNPGSRDQAHGLRCVQLDLRIGCNLKTRCSLPLPGGRIPLERHPPKFESENA